MAMPIVFLQREAREETCLIPAWKWRKNRLLMFDDKMHSKQDVFNFGVDFIE